LQAEGALTGLTSAVGCQRLNPMSGSPGLPQFLVFPEASAVFRRRRLVSTSDGAMRVGWCRALIHPRMRTMPMAMAA